MHPMMTMARADEMTKERRTERVRFLPGRPGLGPRLRRRATP